MELNVNTLVILINGRAGVGKDTFVNYCKEHCAKQYPQVHFENLHRSDLPKKALKLIGWDGNKDPESRTVLKWLVDFGEKYGMTYNYLTDILSTIGGNEFNIVFYHVRDPKSIEVLKDRLMKYRLNVIAASLLIQRDTEDLESDDWGIESYEYDFREKLNCLEESKKLAGIFMDSAMVALKKVERSRIIWE